MRFRVLLSILLLSMNVSIVSAHQQLAVIPMQNTKTIKNIITVAAFGGDFTNPTSAVASISDASSTNLYHVVIGPGIFTIHSGIIMKPYVSISGMGINSTILRGSVSTTEVSTSAIIAGADSSSISGMTIENNGGGGRSVGIYNSGSPIIHDVAVFASGADLNYAICNISSNPVMYDISVKATGGGDAAGIYNSNASPILMNVTATGADGSGMNVGMVNYGNGSPNVNNGTFTGNGPGGAENYGVGIPSSGPEIIIRNSYITGESAAIWMGGGGGTLRIMQSSVVGGVSYESGTISCITSDDGVSSLVGSECN